MKAQTLGLTPTVATEFSLANHGSSISEMIFAFVRWYESPEAPSGASMVLTFNDQEKEILTSDSIRGIFGTGDDRELIRSTLETLVRQINDEARFIYGFAVVACREVDDISQGAKPQEYGLIFFQPPATTKKDMMDHVPEPFVMISHTKMVVRH